MSMQCTAMHSKAQVSQCPKDSHGGTSPHPRPPRPPPPPSLPPRRRPRCERGSSSSVDAIVRRFNKGCRVVHECAAGWSDF
jgi:hypothetical protein